MTLKNTRVGRSPDLARMALAFRRPGIDPRTWVSLAVVDDVVLDPEQGLFAQVTLLPSEQVETVRVSTTYAGSSWGISFPLYKGDEVLVAAPSGDPDEGMVVVGRLHSPADPPPDQVVANPDDVVLVVKPGQAFRVFTSAGPALGGDEQHSLSGSYLLEAGINARMDAPLVVLGTEAMGIQPYLKTLVYRPAEDALFTALGAAISGICGLLATLGGAVSSIGATFASVGASDLSAAAPGAAAIFAGAGAAISAAGAAVTAGAPLITAAFATALTTFTVAGPSFLSTKVKGE